MKMNFLKNIIVITCVSGCVSVNKMSEAPSSGGFRQISSAGKVCDLNRDKCGGTALDQPEVAKTLFLTDIVSEKLLQIEAEEKSKGRDFKIAIIGRMGSNLTKFQPLIDVDSKGQALSVQQLADYLIQKTKDDAPVMDEGFSSSSDNKIDYFTMQKQFDRSKKLKYSHVGIAVKNLKIVDENGVVLTNPDQGQWSVVQLLYSCDDKNSSYIYKGTLGYFFYDHMADYGAQIMVPSQDVQNNLEKIILNNTLVGKGWVEKQYNALALSTDLDQQNSNQYVLELLAASLYPEGQITQRAQAQKILQDTGYSSTKVTPLGIYNLVTSVTGIISTMMPTVCMDHQPAIKKYHIGEIISALSVEDYLKKNNRMQSLYEVEVTDADKIILDKNLGKSKANMTAKDYQELERQQKLEKQKQKQKQK